MSRRVYNSKAWRELRAETLKRDGYECQVRGPLCAGRATAVDHIVPLAAGGAAFDPSNVRASCGKCNSSRTANTAAKYPPPSREW